MDLDSESQLDRIKDTVRAAAEAVKGITQRQWTSEKVQTPIIQVRNLIMEFFKMRIPQSEEVQQDFERLFLGKEETAVHLTKTVQASVEMTQKLKEVIDKKLDNLENRLDKSGRVI